MQVTARLLSCLAAARAKSLDHMLPTIAAMSTLPPARVVTLVREIEIQLEYVVAPIDRVQLQTTICCVSSL
jgi:hypothetical protein